MEPPGWAESLRMANWRLWPGLPRVCAEPPARAGLPPVRSPRLSAGDHRPGAAGVRVGLGRPPAATQLPGGGAAHRASIRERRRGREEGREEEAGFKRKAVTPHKRFL